MINIKINNTEKSFQSLFLVQIMESISIQNIIYGKAMFTYMSSGLDYDHDPNSSYTEGTHLFGDGMS